MATESFNLGMEALDKQAKHIADQDRQIHELREINREWQAAFEEVEALLRRDKKLGDTFVATLERLKLRGSQIQ